MMSPVTTRPFSFILAAAPLLLVGACAAKAAVIPVALAPTAESTPVARSSQAKAAESSDTISISDEIRKACGIADEDAYFAFDSAKIQTTDVRPLDAVATCFTAGPLAGRSLLDATGRDELGWARDRRVDVTLGS